MTTANILIANSSFTAVDTLPSWMNVFNTSGAIYVQDCNAMFQHFGGSRSLIVKDLTNAGKQGASCTRLHIEDFMEYLNAHRSAIPTPAALVELLRKDPASLPGSTSTSEMTAQYTFTPFFDQKAMKAPKMDDKLRLPNVLKFLLKGDYKSVSCTYHSRGDGDFGPTGELDRGAVLALVADITESRSGWGVYWREGKTEISLHCHSFLSYKILV